MAVTPFAEKTKHLHVDNEALQAHRVERQPGQQICNVGRSWSTGRHWQWQGNCLLG